MNSANFHEYLQNPSRLHQISYQELKSLMLQYPYSSNLRYLMLAKSMIDNNKDYDRNLVLASLGSIDRKKLRLLVKQYASIQKNNEHFEIGEEFLELKDLSALQELSSDQATPAEVIKSNQLEIEEVASVPDLDPPVDLETTEIQAEDLTEGVSLKDLDRAKSEYEDDTPMLEDLLGEDMSIENTEQGINGDIDDLFESQPTEEDEEIEEEEIMTVSEFLEYAHFEKDDEGVSDIEQLVAEDLRELESKKEESLKTVEVEESNETVEMTEEEIEINTDSNILPVEEIKTNPRDIPFEITNESEAGQAISSDTTFQPSPKTAFSSWKKKYQAPKKGILDADENIFPKFEQNEEVPLVEEPDDVAREVAAESLFEDNEIVTETLAGVLERQGHFDKAIGMYEKLSLQYPEKSSFFAAKIEKLRKK